MDAVCLISGGMDSCVAAAMARADGYGIRALSFDYGQKNRRETDSARAVARALGARDHRVLPVDLSWTSSSLVREDMEIPESVPDGIPSTYVPARNTVFIALALSYAETLDAGAIYIGVNAVDYSGYPDCRPAYVDRWRDLIACAVKKTVEGGTIRLETPLLSMTKGGIVAKGRELGVDFALTWSCYRGGRRPCGRCPSCILRAKGFAEAGIKDPLITA